MSMKMKLKTKLLAAFLSVGVIPFVILAVVAINKADHALSRQAFDQLVSVRDIKKGQVERYLETIKNQAITFSEDAMIVDTMSKLDYAYDAFRDDNRWGPEKCKELHAKFEEAPKRWPGTQYGPDSREVGRCLHGSSVQLYQSQSEPIGIQGQAGQSFGYLPVQPDTWASSS